MSTQFKIRIVPPGACDDRPPKTPTTPSEAEMMACNRALKDGLVPPGKTACHGCQHKNPGCCYQLTTTTFHEAAAIVTFYEETVKGRFGRITLDAIAQLKMALGLVDRREPDFAGLDGYMSKAWFSYAFPCPMLTSSGKCGVYEHRPDVCAAHWLAEHESPNACQHKTPDDEQTYAYLDSTEGRRFALSVRVSGQLTYDDQNGIERQAPRLFYQGLQTALFAAFVELKGIGAAGRVLEGVFGDVERFNEALNLVLRWEQIIRSLDPFNAEAVS